MSEQPGAPPIPPIPDVPVQPLFNPSRPLRGMVSHIHPSGIPDGFAALLQNVRLGDGTIVCRNGIYEIPGITGLPSGTNIFRGATYWEGAYYAAYTGAARQVRDDANNVVRTVSTIEVYRSTNLVNWTRLTTSTQAKQGVRSNGPGAGLPVYGGNDSRLEDTGEPVFFVPVETGTYRASPLTLDGFPTTRKLLLIGTGSALSDPSRFNHVMVVNGEIPASTETDASASRIAFHRRDVRPPSMGDSLRSYVTFPCYAVIKGPSGMGLSASNSRFQFALVNSGGNRHVRLTAQTTTVSGDTASMTPSQFINPLSGPLPQNQWDLHASRQVVFAYRANVPSVWDNLVVRLQRGTSSVTLYDPRSPAYDRTEVSNQTIEDSFAAAGGPDDAVYAWRLAGSPKSTLEFVAFNLDAVSPIGFNPQRIHFEWVGPTPSVEVQLDIFMVAGSGQWQGLGQFGTTLFNHDGQAESPGVVIPLGGGEKVCNLGGPDYLTEEIVESPTIFYTPMVPIQSPSLLERDRGVDHVLVYRRDFGGTRYLGVGGSTGAFQVAYFSPIGHVWTYVSPWTAENQVQYRRLLYRFGVDANREMPDPFHRGIPPFSCGAVSSGRGFFADESSLSVSEFANPFRHRDLVRIRNGFPDISSPSLHRFPGERVVNVASLASSLYGSNQTLVFTDKNVYSVDSGDPRSTPSNIASMGMAARGSLTEYKRSVWWLDSDRQIRFMSGGSSGDASRGVVEDWFGPARPNFLGVWRGIPQPMLSRPSAAWWNDRLYIAISEPLGSPLRQNRVMVYDPRTEGWVVDVGPAGFSCNQFLQGPGPFDSSGSLIAFGDDGKIFLYDTPFTNVDLGTFDIPVAVWTREFHDDMWNPMRVLRFGIVCDPKFAPVEVSRFFRAGSPADASTVNINQAGVAWRWTGVSGGRGVSGRLHISTDAKAGWRILSMVAEVESSGGTGAGV